MFYLEPGTDWFNGLLPILKVKLIIYISRLLFKTEYLYYIPELEIISLV